MSENNIIRLRGDNVDLCVIRTDEEALKTYVKWMNDESILMWIGRNRDICTWQAERKWLEKDHSEGFNIVLKDGTLIGNCEAHRINNSRNYEIGICIGEAQGRDKGFGTEVVKMLIKFCFEEQNAHRVRLTLNSDNDRARKCYEKAGFKTCGFEHETTWYAGHWADTVYMEILEDDFFNGKEVL